MVWLAVRARVGLTGPRDNVETPGHTRSVARPNVVSLNRVVQRQARATVSSSTGQYGPPRDSRGDRISRPLGGPRN